MGSPNVISFLFALLFSVPLFLIFTAITTSNLATRSAIITAKANDAASTAELVPIKTRSSLVPVDLGAATLSIPVNLHNTASNPDARTAITSDKASIGSNAESNPVKTRSGLVPINLNATTTTLSMPVNHNVTATSQQSAPPLIRVDYKEDELLLKFASKTNPNPKTNTPDKIAFMFLTTASLPFSQLWQLYFNATPTNLYSIYVHADPSFTQLNISSVFSNRLIPSKPTRRNTPTLVSAMRRLLANALLEDPANSHFVLLSASCIPLHSFNFTYKTLTSSNKSFIEVLDHEGGAYGRWASRGKDVMLPEVPFASFRIGSQFWAITRRHATMVVSDRKLWTKFKLPCLHAYDCFPEESYFSTLLNMADPDSIIPVTLTHVDWSGSHDGHPRTYQANDIKPELISQLRSDRPRYGNEDHPSMTNRRHDPFLFARKFSSKSAEKLMNIANKVIFK